MWIPRVEISYWEWLLVCYPWTADSSAIGWLSPVLPVIGQRSADSQTQAAVQPVGLLTTSYSSCSQGCILTFSSGLVVPGPSLRVAERHQPGLRAQDYASYACQKCEWALELLFSNFSSQQKAQTFLWKTLDKRNLTNVRFQLQNFKKKIFETNFKPFYDTHTWERNLKWKVHCKHGLSKLLMGSGCRWVLGPLQLVATLGQIFLLVSVHYSYGCAKSGFCKPTESHWGLESRLTNFS